MQSGRYPCGVRAAAPGATSDTRPPIPMSASRTLALILAGYLALAALALLVRWA
jgi:hypothetical protein